MPSYIELITWKDAVAASLALAGATDIVKIDAFGFTQDVQIARGLRVEAAKSYRRRNHLGRRSFTVTSAPAADAITARANLEALEKSLREFSALTSSTLEWVFGDKKHTLNDAGLESFTAELFGVTVMARYSFVYGSITTVAYP